MSDGPHRNLPLGRYWKFFVQRAGNQSYDLPDMLEALEPALAKSFRNAVPAAVLTRSMRIVTHPQVSLNGRHALSERLKDLRDTTTAGRLGAGFLDSALIALEAGHRGRRALQEAAVSALRDLAGNRKRQIEAHCLGHPSPQAQHVPRRSARAFTELDLQTLADRLLDPRWSPGRYTRRKKTGTDEGLPLPRRPDDR